MSDRDERKKPRPVEFMDLGYSAAQMRQILARWPDLSFDEIESLGFDPKSFGVTLPQCSLVEELFCPDERQTKVSSRSFQDESQSDPNNEQSTQGSSRPLLRVVSSREPHL
jgi:hypothetical protein